MKSALLSPWALMVVGWLGPCWAVCGQAGMWVLEGWPHERNGFFAGKTEIYADGIRLKITEWPESSEDDSESMETYFLGSTGIKVFAWNNERIGLVFELEHELPHAELNSEGQLVLPSPFPARVNDEAQMPCGDGCTYHVRNARHQVLDEAAFAPGGNLNHVFTPADGIPLMRPEEFLERYNIAPPEWASFR